MKKIILSIVFLGLLSSNAFAQRNHRNPITTGIKVGANMSSMTGGNKQDFKPGLQVGGTVEIPLSFYKKFALQAELQYAVQGYKGADYSQIDFNTSEITETIKLENVTTHNLYVPLVIKYYVEDNFSIEVGGQVGYMLSASGGQYDMNKYNTARNYLYMGDSKNGGYISELDRALFEAGYRSKDSDNYYEKLDYGINFGFSYYLENGLYFNARYYVGMQDVYKIDNDYKKLKSSSASEDVMKVMDYFNDNLSFTSMKNNSFQFSVGYKF